MKLADSPGTIALPTSEMQRFLLFTISLCSTNQPPDGYLNATASASVTENLNEIMRALRTTGKKRVTGYDSEGEPVTVTDAVTDQWVWIIGDDHCWPKTALVDMLLIMDEHPEIDVLVPLVTKRNPPWHLVLFNEAGVTDKEGYNQFTPLAWEDVPPPGSPPFEVDAAGSAGMLIRREVLDRIGDPWFYSTTDREGRQITLNEDVTFCMRLRHEFGYRLFATPDVVLGHLGIFNVRAMHNGERWGALTEFSTMDERFRHVFMPVEDQVAVT